MTDSSPRNRAGQLFASDLRSIREQQGVAIKDILDATRLAEDVIEQFEETALLDNPVFNRVYLRSLVSSYARLVDIDEKVALQGLEDTLRGEYEGALGKIYLSDVSPAGETDPDEDADEQTADRAGTDGAEASGSVQTRAEDGADETVDDDDSDDEAHDDDSDDAAAEQGESGDDDGLESEGHSVSEKAVPIDEAPENEAPDDIAPEDTAPEEAAPEDVAPETAAPEDAPAGKDTASGSKDSPGPVAASNRDSPPTTSVTDSRSSRSESDPSSSHSSETDASVDRSTDADDSATSILSPSDSGKGLLLPDMRGLVAAIVAGVVLIALVWISVAWFLDEPEEEIQQAAVPAVDSTIAEPEPTPERVILPDTFEVRVIALDEPLDPIRSRVDNDLRRPYWVELGDTLVFRASETVTLEREVDHALVVVESYLPPETWLEPDGQYVISRQRTQAWLDSLVSEGIFPPESPDTLDIPELPEAGSGAQGGSGNGSGGGSTEEGSTEERGTEESDSEGSGSEGSGSEGSGTEEGDTGRIDSERSGSEGRTVGAADILVGAWERDGSPSNTPLVAPLDAR